MTTPWRYSSGSSFICLSHTNFGEKSEAPSKRNPKLAKNTCTSNVACVLYFFPLPPKHQVAAFGRQPLSSAVLVDFRKFWKNGKTCGVLLCRRERPEVGDVFRSRDFTADCEIPHHDLQDPTMSCRTSLPLTRRGLNPECFAPLYAFLETPPCRPGPHRAPQRNEA